MLCRHCGKPANRLYRGYCDACIDWASHKIAEEEA